MLGLSDRWQTDAFLRKSDAFPDYAMADLERDLSALRDASER